MAFSRVAIGNEKGGVSKTTSGHCIAHGASLFGVPGVYCMTDNRVLLDSTNRSYDIVDGSSSDAIAQFVGKAKAMEGNGLFVIDGAGGNPKADEWYAEICDLFLIPMTADEEALDCALRYAQKFPNAYILPSIWSTNVNASRVDRDYIDIASKIIGADRVLPPAPRVHAVSEFVRVDFDGNILPAARTFCRLLTGAVIAKLQEKGVWK